MLGTLGVSVGRKKRGKEAPGRDDKAVKFDRTLADKAALRARAGESRRQNI